MITPKDVYTIASEKTLDPFYLGLVTRDSLSGVNRGGFDFKCEERARWTFLNRVITLSYDGTYFITSSFFKNYVECHIRLYIWPTEIDCKDGYKYDLYYKKYFRGDYTPYQATLLIKRLLNLLVKHGDDPSISSYKGATIPCNDEEIFLYLTENTSIL